MLSPHGHRPVIAALIDSAACNSPTAPATRLPTSDAYGGADSAVSASIIANAPDGLRPVETQIARNDATANAIPPRAFFNHAHGSLTLHCGQLLQGTSEPLAAREHGLK